MAKSLQTVSLVFLAVLAVGCSESGVTNVARPTAQPAPSVEEAFSVAPPAPVKPIDNALDLGLLGEDPHALPEARLPSAQPTGKAVATEEAGRSRTDSSGSLESRRDATPGLPRLPGTSRYPKNHPNAGNAQALPGLPNSPDHLSPHLPGLDDEARLIPSSP